MLWFALHLPCLPLDAQNAPDGSDRTPRAVVEQRRIVVACAQAQALGVHPGQAAATAASLAPGLVLHIRDAAREAELTERLALVLAQFTPVVVRQVDGAMADVAGSRRLFGGTRRLATLLQQRIAEAGVPLAHQRWAAAPTPSGAALLARVSSAQPRQPFARRLDALPLADVLAAWQQPPRLAELLHGIGCRTLADVRALPRTGLQRRGGAALLDAVARTYGDAPDPQPLYEPPPTFERSLELMQRADDAASLVFAAQRLVQPLAGWLALQWRAASRLALVLRHEGTRRRAVPDSVLTLALGEPSRDAAQLMLLLRERLQRTALPAPVYAITLRLDESLAHAGRAGALWRGAGAAGDGESALIDRLAARLGVGGVLRPVLAADHRPERAQRWQPASEPAAVRKERTDEQTAPRPTWLLPEPERLHEANNRPLLAGVPLVLLTRAERIEAGWFDGAAVARDYHVALAADQRCLWVFHERRDNNAGQWFLHGVFA